MPSINIGTRLRNAREAVGLKQNEAATKLNISNSNLSRYEKGDRTPDTAMLLIISKLYGLTIDQLVSISDYKYPFLYDQLFEKDMDNYLSALLDFLLLEVKKKGRYDPLGKILILHGVADEHVGYSGLDPDKRERLIDKLFTFDIASQKLKPDLIPYFDFNSSFFITEHREKVKDDNKADLFVSIPVLGIIKAGYDLYAEQQILDYEIVPKKWVQDGEYFFLNVTGDSMIEDGIKDGCRVLVRHQNHVESGKVAVVVINGDEGTLKRIFYQDDMIILQASNSKIPPRFLHPAEVLIQGQVVKVEFDMK